ncbi:PIG-X [Triangularia verruculosa]|uniref:Protein PBN1 n=1 Tax=Triangularia verruculosa TaxID=2587418 RepID=A0AAN7ASW7_9PEZI|nr:PIG-X [Triangularia verruculosa]
MRERITFVQKEGDSIEPTALKVDASALSGPDVKAVREDRLTLALDELPNELKALLEGVSQLHIRWVDRGEHEAVSPLLARLPPGFHLFYTPGSDTSINPCPLLTRVFGLNSCSSPAESFTTLPTDRFTHSTTHQFYQPLPSLSSFINFAKSHLCPSDSPKSCSPRLSSLHRASHLDISYDTISHTLRVTSLWPYSSHSLSATLLSPSIRTEIGIISTASPKTLEAHEIAISGLLTVLGQSNHPSPTLFTFPSRHRSAAPVSFTSQFLSPTGLHPVLQLSITSPTPPIKSPNPDSCRLHAYFTLPKTVFPDRHQLSDPLFLASKNLSALRYITPGIDLEAPEYVTNTWGSSLLLELSPPLKGGEWTAQVPLHLRYLSPSVTGYRSAEVPYPAVFWACEAEEGTRFPVNPFEKDKVGYDGLFGERTVFWHLDPTTTAGDGVLVNGVKVPVLNLEKAGWVNVGTAVVVGLGFLWVVFKLLGVGFAGGRKVDGEEKKKRQ